MLRHDEAVTMFNKLQEHLTPEQRDRLQEEDSQAIFIDMMRRSTQYALEDRILFEKGNRYLDMLQANDPSADNFFQQYVQKLFDGTDMDSVESFALIGDTPAQREQARLQVQDRLREVIKGKITKMMAWERQAVNDEEKVLLDIIAKKDLPAIVVDLSDDERSFVESTMVEAQELSKRRTETRHNSFVHDYNHIIFQSKAVLERISGNPKDVTDKEVTLLKDLVARSNIPHTLGVEGQEINVMHLVTEALKNLENHTASPADIEHLQQILLVSHQELQTLLSKVDKQSGLQNRGEYYLALQDRLKKSENRTDGKTVRTVFIDLGFLKYFASAGGEAVVSFALQNTGEVLDAAIVQANIDGEAFRYAGDEFTIQFTGDADDERRLINTIDELKKSKGAIPNTDQSNSLYRPEPLEINHGTANSELAEQAIISLTEAGLIDENVIVERGDEYYTHLAEIQTRLADLSIESQKAFSRFILLMEKIRGDFPDGIPGTFNLQQRQTELMVKYSQKAVFGMSLTKLYELSMDPAYDFGTPEGVSNLQQLIDDEKVKKQEVMDRIIIEEDEIVATFVKEHALLQEIAKLESEVVDLTKQYEEAEKARQQLEGRNERLLKNQEEKDRVAESGRITEIQQLLDEQRRHEEKIEHKRSLVTKLHAQRQDFTQSSRKHYPLAA